MSDHAERVRDLLVLRERELSTWEADFLESIEARPTLTSKQEEKLTEIERKHERG